MVLDELHQQLQELQIAHKSCVQELARTEDSNRELSEEKERLEQQKSRLRKQVNNGDRPEVHRKTVTINLSLADIAVSFTLNLTS